MTYYTLVKPADIESQLLRIWEDLAKVNKTRACLFNLIVYAKMNNRHDYIRRRVQKIIDEYPCRILFITSDPDSSKDYLKTAVSVAFPAGEDSSIACDTIDIGVGGKSEKNVPFVILPHIIPDLPVYLLWTEDPAQKHALFAPLEKLALRLIFDSESSDHLYGFAETLIKLAGQKEIADLNWARTESWRDLLAAQFYSEEKLNLLKTASSIQILYNSHESEFFCHLKIQALYLQAWLASRLGWKLKSVKTKKGTIVITYTHSRKKEVVFELIPTNIPELTSGAIVSFLLETEKKEKFFFYREKDKPYQVSISLSTLEQCELPTHFIIGKDVSGLSLSKEINYRGTSQHYVNTLKLLTGLKNPKIC